VILVDTNVISVLCKAKPDPQVLKWIGSRRAELIISAITIAEMAFGIACLPVGLQRKALRERLEDIKHDFLDRIVPFTAVEAETFGTIMAHCRAIGRPMSIPDCQIAATAIVLKVPLATRNTKDFEYSGLELINPWTPISNSPQ
jgi:predicted nucleic acid-binding protein